MKKLARLLALTLASRHGHGPIAGGYKPWKRRKWKAHKQYGYGPYHGHQPGYPPPPPYGYGYGHPRPRGIKGLIVEAILHKLLRR